MSETDQSGIIRAFSVLIGQIEDGRLHTELSQVTKDLLEKVEGMASASNSKSKATLDLKMTFNADPDGLIELTCEYTAKAPKMKRGRTIFWTTPEHNLTRQDPKQQNLPFRDINMPRSTGGLA